MNHKEKIRIIDGIEHIPSIQTIKSINKKFEITFMIITRSILPIPIMLVVEYKHDIYSVEPLKTIGLTAKNLNLRRT